MFVVAWKLEQFSNRDHAPPRVLEWVDRVHLEACGFAALCRGKDPSVTRAENAATVASAGLNNATRSMCG